MIYMGLDTSNYTTSIALLSESLDLTQKKQLLPVREGALGLRQSDAVFEHTRALPAIVEECFESTPRSALRAVGASVRPRDIEGSYMPCFLVGSGVGRALAAASGAAFYEFSHQAGHVAASVYSSGHLELLEKPFVCLHFSGGTTDCMLVRPHPERVIDIELIAASQDLMAGQAVDRVGGMLGLPFPAGEALSALAMKSDKSFSVKPAFRGGNVSLSGVQNQCESRRAAGEPPQDIAAYCLSYIAATAEIMIQNALERYGALPIVFAGGVMESRLVRAKLSRYSESFAHPSFSSDNAVGTAVLTMLKDRAVNL